MAIIQRPINDTGTMLRIGGAFTAIFSMAMGLLVLFALPIACTFVGSLQLIILFLLFMGGLLAFLMGFALSRRKVKPK